jgi:outer membrane protein TolC
MGACIFIEQQLFDLADRQSRQSVRAQQDSSRLMVNDVRELVSLNVVSNYLDALRAKTIRDTVARANPADE